MDDELMRPVRWLLAPLPVALSALIACFAPLQLGNALVAVNFDGPQHTVAYTGPCDLVTCAEAYSVTRAMTTAYAGNLFQLGRQSDSSTLNIGQTGARKADTSGIAAFCAGTQCFEKLVYGQINSNNLRPPVAADGSLVSGCTTATTCAPPFGYDGATGLPIVRTLNPGALYIDTHTGITGGTNATTVYWYGRNEGWSGCCGLFGVGHLATAADTAGTDFLPGLAYGTGQAFNNASTATTIAANVDIELLMTNGADYTPTSAQNISGMATFDGGSPGTIKVYINSATAIYSGAPAAGTTMNIGPYPRIGGGGDLSHVDAIWREGLITNSALSSSDYTAINSNVSAFYAAANPACYSTADIGYAFGTAVAFGGSSAQVGFTDSIMAYALRQLSASYTGPLADLRDAAGTTKTFLSSNCDLGSDTANTITAATFCGNNPPCTASRVYNQGIFSSQNTGNVHDGGLDLVQATVGSQPEVVFSGLNGHATLKFSGSQKMCTGTIGAQTGFMNFAAMVAKRTSGTGSFASALQSFGSNTFSMGFGNASGQLVFYNGILINAGALTENAFHSINAEDLSGTVNLYGDNSSVGTAGGSHWSVDTTNATCIGQVSSGGPNALTGEIAEVVLGVSGDPSTADGLITLHTALYNAQHAAWGI